MTPTQKLERVVKAVIASFLLVPPMLLLTSTLGAFWDPTSPLRHFRETPVLPPVLAKGTLRSAPAVSPIVLPLCEVRWQRWGSCGRSPCWVTLAELKVAEGSLDVAWSSSPIPRTLTISNAWNAEPELDANVVTDPQRGATWLARAKLRSVDHHRVTEESGKDRLLERCVDDGSPLYVEGCVVGNELGPCPGRNDFSLVPSASPRPAIVAAADVLALKVGGELLLLIPATLLLIPPRGALVNALSARGGRKPGGVGAAWWLLVLPFGAGVWNLFTDAKHGGLILLFAAALAWALITKHLCLGVVWWRARSRQSCPSCEAPSLSVWHRRVARPGQSRGTRSAAAARTEASRVRRDQGRRALRRREDQATDRAGFDRGAPNTDWRVHATKKVETGPI